MKRNSFTAIALVAIACMMLTGCQPLKKKFIRQKKKNENAASGIVPVLEPQEYPAPGEDKNAAYAHHYAMWKIWYKDLVAAIEDENRKRQRYDVEQMFVQLDGMLAVLSGDKRTALEAVKGRLVGLQEELNKPAVMRDFTQITSKLRALDREVRRDFKPEILEGEETP